jgi:hypothetical protein
MSDSSIIIKTPIIVTPTPGPTLPVQKTSGADTTNSTNDASKTTTSGSTPTNATNPCGSQPGVVPQTPDSVGTEPTAHAFIKIEQTKTDSVSLSFDDKKPKPDTIQSLPFVDKPADNSGGLKSVVEDLTTIGPVKIVNITVPTPGIAPNDGKDKDKSKTTLVPGPTPGTGAPEDKDKIALKIKVEF